MIKKFLMVVGLIAILAVLGNMYTKRHPEQPGIINPSKIPTKVPGFEVKTK